MKYYTDKGRDGQDKQEKTCCKTQHVKIDMERDASIIICRMAAVGENYNWTRDSKKSPPVRKEGGAIMMMEYITLAGFILAVFGSGVAVGRIVEKIERLDRKKEDEEHKNTSKNDRQ